MPKLLLFAPCERVILGQGDNSASLIGIIQQVQFQHRGPAGGPAPVPPPGAVIPVRLSIFSEWHRLATDGNAVFEQRLTLSIANEDPIFEAVTEFEMTERLHRVIANVITLPFMHPGEYGLRVFLRRKGDRDWGQPMAVYPFEVAEMQPVVPANQ